ncbi:MAG TPA: cold shock domain-containing protein [Candidatus Omnitrophota bacterium]|nr:cold shock domain-containing protein [Candidatus Omnitrophota bacterium]
MERGTIKTYDMGRGFGIILRLGSMDVEFYANSIIGRDRTALKSGDQVWYEIENVRSHHTAINIRKCM